VTGQARQFNQHPAQFACSVVVFGAILLLAAWKWEYPAYVFVFWLLLTAIGFVVNRSIYLVIKVSGGRLT
jgi:hypothetical protein